MTIVSASAKWLAVLCLLSLPAWGGERWSVAYVVDGDTVAVQIPLSAPEKVRVRGVDTPELHTRSQCEKAKALDAKAFTEQFLQRGQPVFSNLGRDKYGRILATVTVGGQDLAQALIREGLGRAYEGGRRQSWC